MVTLRLTLAGCIVFLASLDTLGQETKRVPAPYHSSFEGQTLTSFQLGLATDPVALLLMADSSVTAEEYAQGKVHLSRYLEELKAERTSYASPKLFLRWLFRRTHEQFLRQFVAYESFSQLLEEGVYNCVSATALFALLLGELGYPYQIYETPFHLYLLVEYKPRKRWLLESTDAVHGLVTGQQAIASRQIRYGKPDSSGWCAKAALCTLPEKTSCPARYVHPISLTELCGLQYVNQAIGSYNRLALQLARNGLLKAEMLYPSAQRIKGLKTYVQHEEVRAKNLTIH